MDSQLYTIELESILVSKFKNTGSRTDSIDILPQVQEMSIYESVFSSILRCELAVLDFIGLFINFPLSGEEFVTITYKNTADGIINTLYFVIDSVGFISLSENSRAEGYIIKLVSLEGLANGLQTVQQAYEGEVPMVARRLFEEHINNRIREFLPSYVTQNFDTENNETLISTIIIPNLRPFAAIDMLAKLAVAEVQDRYSYLFYQTPSGFNFKTVQGLTQGVNARRFARNNPYRFLSNAIAKEEPEMRNQERIVSNLVVNKRHAGLQKLSSGYFHNNYVEINIAQKAIWFQHQKLDDIKTISPHALNTREYIDYVSSVGVTEEESNKTKYVVTTQREGDRGFPVSRMRSRWGQDTIANIAMSQVDFTVTIPGTNRFKAGDLFYLEYPEIHGFDEVNEDDLVSGYFLITDIKHVIVLGGIQTTVMRINKDSYNTTIDRENRYAK